MSGLQIRFYSTNITTEMMHGITKRKLEELAQKTAMLIIKLTVKDGLAYFVAHKGDSHFHLLALRA